MSMIAGWFSVALVLVSLAPSIVPGAFSVLGLLISLIALVISVFSVRKSGKKYFITTITIVVISVLLVNDGLRIWGPLEMPINMKLVLYGICCFVIISCSFLANKLANEK